MPDETHRFLIQYETTATRAAAEMQQVTRTLQEQVQWVETATRAYQRRAGEVSRATQAQVPGFRLVEPEMPLAGRERLAERLEAIGADVQFTTEAFRRYDEAVAAHIPTEMAVSQAIRETAITFRTLQKEIDPTLSGLSRLQARLQEIGASTRVTTAQQPVAPSMQNIVAPIAGAEPTTEELRRFVEEGKTSMQGLGEATDFTSRAIARYNELIAANIPEQHAINQAISETVKAFRAEGSAARRSADALAKRQQVFTRARQVTGGPGGEVGISPEELFVQREHVRTTRQQEALEAFERAQTFEGRMAESMEARGIFQEHQIRIAERYNEVLGESLSPQDAFARAQREIAKELQDTGEATRKSGHWLGNYIQRYLIRYLVVWQGMVALKAGIRDWIQAHDDMARSIFRVQGAMQATTSEARQYMGVLAGVGAGIGVPAGQMVEGAIQTGQPQLVGQMAQWGQVTGAGPQQAIELFTRMQRDYNLTAEGTTMIMARLFVAWDKLGIPIQEITSDLGKWLGKVGEGPGLIDYMNQRMEEFGEQGLNATDRISTGWHRLLSQIGDTSGFSSAKIAAADLFDFLNENVDAIDFALRTAPPFNMFFQAMEMAGAGQETAAAARVLEMPAHEEWRLTGVSPTEQAGGPAGIGGGAGTRLIDSVQIMTQAQFGQMDKLTQQHEESLAARGIRSKELTQQVAISTEQGYVIQSIDTTLLAMLLATEDMRDMQRQQLTGFFNWPGDQPSVMVGRPSQAEFAQREAVDRPRDLSTAALPTPSPWATPDMPWGDICAYQHGGIVPGQGPQPAIVHGGETILPRGSAAMGSIKLHSHLYLNSREVASDVSKIQGDKLLQAQRASMGTTGGLIAL